MSAVPKSSVLSAPLWRRALARFTASNSDLAAEEAQEDALRHGGTPCGQVPDRTRACVCGTLRSVTLRPRGGVPALEAELFDGSGSVQLVWLGRRRIAGVEPGRRVKAKGLVACDDGQRVIFNPVYELVCAETAERA
ncbi:OB-fold nucleic acid binding domain-containing protein [Kineococcus sp. TBRC 1896]|uniref:OB-fold nucleic acid binding domain-containing protein n=1 Tax=Kineococcus mangrovi TaxID=1660183 RepID=A0ABV4I4J1_9ACTN